MIQQMWRPFQRLVRGMALRCWVRQLPHDAELPVRVKVGDKVIASTLEADSFNTFVVRHETYEARVS
jgi:hypothetical protein